MRRRRRYEVVVEGLSGQAASQRSVISEHRSESDARENAALERARLEVIYGDGARAWQILVVREDEVIAVETPHGGTETRRRAAARAPRSMEPDPLPDPLPEVEESVVVIRPPHPAAPPEPAQESGDAVPEAPSVAQDAPRDADPPPAPDPDRPGRVPDWLIERFEESIARQRDRTYGTGAGDEDEPRGR